MTGHVVPVSGRTGVGSGPREIVMRRVISLTFLEVLGVIRAGDLASPSERPCNEPRSRGLQLRDSAGFTPASPLSLENDPAFRNAWQSILRPRS
jgi:hypothetical protein